MTEHDTEHAHDHHHEDDVSTATLGVLTVSSSRTLADDPSGDAIVDIAESNDLTVATRDLVADDRRAIRRAVDRFAADSDVDAVITTGGTGLTEDDVTVEALEPLFDREIPGFGERFRALSVEDIGPNGMLTRAAAGISGTVPIFCLPGSEAAARLGTGDLIVPTLGHVLGLVGNGDGHGHDH